MSEPNAFFHGFKSACFDWSCFAVKWALSKYMRTENCFHSLYTGNVWWSAVTQLSGGATWRIQKCRNLNQQNEAKTTIYDLKVFMRSYKLLLLYCNLNRLKHTKNTIEVTPSCSQELFQPLTMPILMTVCTHYPWLKSFCLLVLLHQLKVARIDTFIRIFFFLDH